MTKGSEPAARSSRALGAVLERFALDRPFCISRGVKNEIEVITVSVSNGVAVGRGEGVPYPRYGEDGASALEALSALRPAFEAGLDRGALQDAMPPGAARNALDCALWDLEARTIRRSVASTIGIRLPSLFRTALTVSLDRPETMAETAAALPAAALIKVKVDNVAPEEQLRAVRGAAPTATIIVDPNESWDERLVRSMQPLLAELGVALLEQPVPAGHDAWLAEFTPEVPICADESLHTRADLAEVSRRYQAVNVKLDKAGGLTAALELAQAAREQDLIVMTGCMICSSLSIAPALHLAPWSDYLDLDGPLWLRQDRLGGVTQKGREMAAPKKDFWGAPATVIG